ncbi:hypothetical protein L3X38_016812 [Prunus dulcis]|uniref:Uncharacterized protein n=1 Tax=Prunus dulcis TaxID=3755 RepID=A0AAD4W6M7_PRUDU|nr:hypothetical protein L3X38_016812 [Prunus dulcis]
MILAVDEQKQLLEDVILVFPQPITLNSFSSFEEHVDQGEKFPSKEKKDPGCTVVSNKKEFSLKMLVILAREKVRLSQEVHNLYNTFAYKSPKKRTREVIEEIEEGSDLSVEIVREVLKVFDLSTSDILIPNP